MTWIDFVSFLIFTFTSWDRLTNTIHHSSLPSVRFLIQSSVTILFGCLSWWWSLIAQFISQWSFMIFSTLVYLRIPFRIYFTTCSEHEPTSNQRFQLIDWLSGKQITWKILLWATNFSPSCAVSRYDPFVIKMKLVKNQWRGESTHYNRTQHMGT